MREADFLYQEAISPSLRLAADRFFLDVRTKSSPVLHIYTFAGDVLAIGRYHAAPPALPAEGVSLYRRLSGGRAIPFGRGFVGFSLLLPHRSALYSDDSFALKPEQVMNRYVRGLLRGLQALGLPALYPGRDLVTVHGKTIGLVSFETDENGALVFEAILAGSRDFCLLPQLLDRTDPEGVIKAELFSPEGVTSLTRELQKDLTPRQVGEILRQGYAEQYHLHFREGELSPLERQAIETTHAREYQGNQWLMSRTPRADLPCYGVSTIQLGVLEAYFALERGGLLREVRFCGDFLANSAALKTLEKELRLCPAEWEAVARVTDRIFSQPENFILGIGQLHTIPDTIMKGMPK